MTGRTDGTDTSREGPRAFDGNREASPSAPMEWRPLVPAFVALILSYFALMLVIVNNPTGAYLFNHDILGVHRFFLDVFEFEQFPVDGHRTPVALFYFPDYLLWFPLALLFPYEVTYVLYCLVILLVSAVGWVFVCRQLGASSAFQSAAVFAHVLQIILLAYPGNEIFMLLVMPIFHSGVWVFMPWLLWAALNDSRSGRAGLFVLTALLALSDLIVVPWFVGPFFVAVGMAWWQGGFSSKRALESSAIVALATVTGRSSFNSYTPFAESQNTSDFLSIKMDAVFSHLVIQGRGLLALADQHGWLAIIWLLFAALIALLLYHYLLVRKADSKVLFVLTFVPVSIIVSAIAPALTENVHFPLAFPLGIEYPTVNVVEIGRYLYPTLFLPLFVGWPLLIFIASRQLAFSIPNPPFRVSPILLAISVIVATPSVVRSGSFQSISPFETPYAVCVREAARRLGWTGGIGVYRFWDQAVIDPNNPIRQNLVVEKSPYETNASVDYRPLRVMWDVSNRHWYSGEFQVVAVDTYREKRFLFSPRHQGDACLPDGQCREYFGLRALDEEMARRVFGDPQEIVECEGVALFHYDPPLIYDFSSHTQTDHFPISLPLRNPEK